tara:strand:+ start:20694 stop:21080 length:387 start_codon:yes stop_codon:yes gene_type:complete
MNVFERMNFTLAEAEILEEALARFLSASVGVPSQIEPRVLLGRISSAIADALLGCDDCRANVEKIGEYYFLENPIWERASGGCDILCIGCFEKRLGRALTKPDFIPAHQVEEHRQSDRWKRRIGLVAT